MAKPVMASMPYHSAEAIENALAAFAPLKRDLALRALAQPYPGSRVIDAFKLLQAPLGLLQLQGDLLNPWAIAGLKRDEVRVAQALAGLWRLEFGGAA